MRITTVKLVLAGMLLSMASQILADVESSRTKGLAWLLQNQNGDGSWGKGGAKMAATTEVVKALQQSGADQGFIFTRALSWIANASDDTADTLARKIITLESAGIDTADIGLPEKLLNMGYVIREYDQNGVTVHEWGWGLKKGYHVSYPDTPLALEAIMVSRNNFPQSEWYYILKNIYGADGGGAGNGWEYMGGKAYNSRKSQEKTPKIFPTAFNTRVAAMYVARTGANNPKSGIKNFSSWLYSKQDAVTGGFSDDTSVLEGGVVKTALAYLAIDDARQVVTLSFDPVTSLAKAQSYLIDRQAADGSWEGDAYGTGLALQTLSATNLPDSDGDGIPDVVEPVVGTDPFVPDEQSLLPSNGLDAYGLQATGFQASPVVLEKLIGQTIYQLLRATGGTPPYAWSRAGGTLPIGVLLQNSPVSALSGTPITPGVYTFSLRITDARGRIALTPGYVSIIASSDLETDTDQDGVPSYIELANGWDSVNASDANIDPDNDGLGNAQEIAEGTDPTRSDSDSDGMPDGWEVTHGFQPTNGLDGADDRDGDGLSNALEYVNGTVPNDGDSDNDGLGDGWEVVHNLSPINPADASFDGDGDGLSNLEEFSLGTDPQSNDSDQDGLIDGWEVASGLNPLDGSDGDQDADNDGLTNLEEQDENTDPNVADSDGDGMLDGAEVLLGRNPLLNEPAILVAVLSILLN